MQHSYIHKSLSGVKAFLLAASVVALASTVRDGLLVGLLAWFVVAAFNDWHWGKVTRAFESMIAENSRDAGVENSIVGQPSVVVSMRVNEFVKSRR